MVCEACELKLRMLALWPPSASANAEVLEQVSRWTEYGEVGTAGHRPPCPAPPSLAGARPVL